MYFSLISLDSQEAYSKHQKDDFDHAEGNISNLKCP
jgi:hypothetical protein